MADSHSEALLQPLPPGRHKIPRAKVEASQRNRLLRAVVQVVGERSYAATTIASITDAADVSKKTFYAYFTDKEDCFLEAYDAFAKFVITAIEEGFATATKAGGHWLDHYRGSTAAYLQVMAAEPTSTRALMLEVLTAGPKALAMRRKVMRSFEDNLRAVHAVASRENPDLAVLPDEAYLITIGGVDELVRQYITTDRTTELPELLPTIVNHVAHVFGASKWIHAPAPGIEQSRR